MQSHSLIVRRRVLLALGGLTLARFAAAENVEERRTGGPYVPTPQVVVDEMLRLGKVGPNDFVIDLGSGDGVIVLTAAQKHKARGFGVDIDPELVKLSNNEAKKRGLDDRVAFHVQDVFKTDISKATVVTLYLLPGMMVNLRPKILNELKPGTRVVSHDYHFDDWPADQQYTWDVPEKEKVNGVPRATIYVWIVPAKVAGRWQLRLDSGEQHELTLRQQYQSFNGADTKGHKLLATQLRGDEISFALPPPLSRQFKGRVAGESMSGVVEIGGGQTTRWSATKVKA